MTDGGWHDGGLLGLDFETTGVDRRWDVPVSFALIALGGGEVVDRRVRLVDPGRPIPPEATAIHRITDDMARCEGVPLAEAILEVAGAVLAAGRRGVPVVGMNVGFDLSILDHQLEGLTGAGLLAHGWRGPVLDVLVLDRHVDRYRKGKRRLDELCAHYHVAVEESHEAGADALAAIGVLRVLCDRFPMLQQTDLAELTARQARWHREWATGYGRWRAAEGMEPLEEGAFDWPLLGRSWPEPDDATAQLAAAG